MESSVLNALIQQQRATEAQQRINDANEIKNELSEIKATVSEIYKMIWSMKSENIKTNPKEDTKKSIQKATK